VLRHPGVGSSDSTASGVRALLLLLPREAPTWGCWLLRLLLPVPSAWLPSTRLPLPAVALCCRRSLPLPL
jgi:hypothetical protein